MASTSAAMTTAPTVPVPSLSTPARRACTNRGHIQASYWLTPTGTYRLSTVLSQYTSVHVRIHQDMQAIKIYTNYKQHMSRVQTCCGQDINLLGLHDTTTILHRQHLTRPSSRLSQHHCTCLLFALGHRRVLQPGQHVPVRETYKQINGDYQEGI